MRPRPGRIAVILWISLLLAGCGGTKSDQAAEATQIAAAVGATLAAGAPPPAAPVITVVVTPVPPTAASAPSAEPAAGGAATEPPAPAPTQPPSAPPATGTLAPMPSSGQPTRILLRPGGEGDYPTLADAIRSAPPGAHIVLEPGLYSLEEALTVTQPLMLEGSGANQTVIHSLAAEHVLKFEGAGPFVAEGITFRHDGPQPANVVVVFGGEIDFAFCTFTGGVFSAEAGYGGSGLFLGSTTTGRVVDCESTRNQEQGILVREQARPSITQSSLHHNGGCGIGYFGQAGGYAGSNDASHNTLHGICLNDTAMPVLEGNRCRHNTYSGIVYFGQSGGEARGNDCSLNGQDGIAMQGQAQPLLEGNGCFANGQIDIAYFDSAAGTAQFNRCSTDAPYGLYVLESAGPTLVENQCPLSGVAAQTDGGGAPGPLYNPDNLEGLGPVCFNRPPPALDREWQTSAGTGSIILGESVVLTLRNKWGETAEAYEATARVVAPDGTETSAVVMLTGDQEATLVYPDAFGGNTGARGTYSVIWEIDGGFVACTGFVTIGGAG